MGYKYYRKTIVFPTVKVCTIVLLYIFYRTFR